VRLSGFVFRVYGSGLEGEGLRFKNSGSVFQVFRFGVSGFGFMVQGSGVGTLFTCAVSQCEDITLLL